MTNKYLMVGFFFLYTLNSDVDFGVYLCQTMDFYNEKL